MLRTVRRLAIIASSGALLVAVHAFPAVAAATSPGVKTLAATNVKSSSATLNGSIKTHGQATEYQFRWGKHKYHLGNSTALQTIPSGKGKVHVSANITGLKPNTTYYFRLIATSNYSTPNYAETSRGNKLSFKSSVKAQVISKKPTTKSGFTG